MLPILFSAAVGLHPALITRTATIRATQPPRLVRAPLAALNDGPIELPSDVLLRAVEGSGRVSAADIAAASGLDLLETRRQLLILAQIVGADLQVLPSLRLTRDVSKSGDCANSLGLLAQVSSDGELLFVFEPNVRSSLRR